MIQVLKHSGQVQFLIATIAVLVAFYSWKGTNNNPKSAVQPPITISSDEEKLFTAEQLALFDGSEEGRGIFIAILGRIYDVDRGRRHYGPGGSYNFFAGRDATTAFISGDFETVNEELDDVLRLPPRDILAVYNWQKFYDKDYTYVGKLIGRYYDADGEEKEYLRVVRDEVRKEEANNVRLEKEKQEFPPCNTKWSAEEGSTFWCSTKSGGIEREWTGVPRKIYKPGQTDFNCVCVEESKLADGNLKEFDDCDPKSTKCTFNLDVKWNNYTFVIKYKFC